MPYLFKPIRRPCGALNEVHLHQGNFLSCFSGASKRLIEAVYFEGSPAIKTLNSRRKTPDNKSTSQE